MNTSAFTNTLLLVGTLLSPFAFSAPEAAHDSVIRDNVQKLDQYSVAFNANPKPDKVNTLITGYETLMGRPFQPDERKFLEAEFSKIKVMPRFAMKNKAVEVYQLSGKTREILVTMEVVDPKKNLFRYNDQTFELNADQGFLANLQKVVQGLNAAESQ